MKKSTKSSKAQPSAWNTIAEFSTAIENLTPALDDTVKTKLLVTLMQELGLIQPSVTTVTEEKYKYIPYPVRQPYWNEYPPYWPTTWPPIIYGSSGQSISMSESPPYFNGQISSDISLNGQHLTGRSLQADFGYGITEVDLDTIDGLRNVIDKLSQ